MGLEEPFSSDLKCLNFKQSFMMEERHPCLPQAGSNNENCYWVGEALTSHLGD